MNSRMVFCAVDVGASGGRVMAGIVQGDTVTLHPVHRFGNGVARLGNHLRWDLAHILDEIEQGLRLLAATYPDVVSIGIDTWAVDYGALDDHGGLLAPPISYRDGRVTEAVQRLDDRISRTEQYAANGLQHLPFTTIYQLEAEREGPLWDRIAHIALIPDLIGHHLTGVLRTERTNASTTGLLDPRSGTWSPVMLAAMKLPDAILPPLQSPGDILGPLTSQVRARTGLGEHVVVTAVGSHDTASAVVGVPATSPDFAYVSSGTWSLVGLELDEPVLSPGAQAANFTNEGGVDGRVRFLRNVGGLWLLQESLRQWHLERRQVTSEGVLAEAALLPSGGPTIDVDDKALIAPDDMPARIGAAAGGHAELPSPAHTVRCILDSLSTAYAHTVATADALTGRTTRVIHIVGGGSRNDLLCQLTADLSGRPVVAGPAEATALGNILIQARAHGAAAGSLNDLRSLLDRSTWNSGAIKKYSPTESRI